jgi:hypothetical protein
MSGARLRALGLVVLIAAVSALAYAQLRQAHSSAAVRGHRPTLLLLTSLPLMFGEDFSLEGMGSPTLKALQSRYSVIPISVADPRELSKGRILLAAQPRAQPPDDLVALDRWVRDGGRLMLLADPMLEWPSDRPLGDRLRPPPTFMDTGLLAHWGLRLEAPNERGAMASKLGGYPVLTISPGRLSGSCTISKDRILAHCRLGRGRVTIIADADLLDVERLGVAGSHNLEGALAELERLG